MEAVAPDGTLFAQFHGDRVEVSLRGHVGVKGGLKCADHGCGGHQRLELPDGGNVGRIVGGSHGVKIRHGLQHILRQILYAGDAPGMDDLEAHTGDFFQRFDAARQQVFQHLENSLPVGREDGLHTDVVSRPVVFVIEQAFSLSDPLCAAGCKDLLSVAHIKQLVFQGSASHVADENIHRPLLMRFFLFYQNFPPGEREKSAKEEKHLFENRTEICYHVPGNMVQRGKLSCMQLR